MPGLPPIPDAPNPVLDTTLLSNGTHGLSIVVPQSGALATVSGSFQVDNGPPGGPAFVGGLRDVTLELGLPTGFFSGTPQALPGMVAGDLDGDGDADLFVWFPSDAHAFAQVYLQTAPWVFEPAGPPLERRILAAGLADLDGDGLLDVVAVGTDIAILHNVGGALVDVGAASGLLPASAGGRMYMGVTFADIDNDGLLDIAIAQLHCQGDSPNVVLRNEGALHFADVTAALGLTLADRATYAIEMDVLEDGLLHVSPFNEGCKPATNEELRYAPGADLPELVDRTPTPDGATPMGTAWLDVNGDGLLDHWIAGCDNSPLRLAPSLMELAGAYAGLDAFAGADGRSRTGWAMVLFAADLDGRPDVFATHASCNDPTATMGAGHGLHWQRAPGKFRNVAALAGVTAGDACKAAHGADVDGDGDTDILIGCRDGLQVLKNDLVDPSVGRTVILHGTLSNPNGIHARITTPTGESRIVRGGGQPFAGGLVQESVRAPSGTLTVTWPSGIVQTVDVGAGPVLHVTEPAVVAVAPRRVAAGSTTPISVEVRPALLGDPGAAVVVDAGTAAWGSPLARGADGVWRGTILPSAAPATVVLAVTVGATKLLVRPRVFVR